MLEISHPFDLQAIEPSLTKFVGYGGIPMTTVAASFGKVDVADVLEGRAKAIEVVATSDGRGYARGDWHAGGPSHELVYVEVYSDRGREFHGWIHAESRQLVQAG